MRILLIEDSNRLRRTLSLGLQREGYRIDAAADGLSGLDLAHEADYDLIILDLMLPQLDGLSVLKRLRAAGVQSAILILTARDRVEDRVEGLNLGADDYLSKPFALEELFARIGALLRRRYDHRAAQLKLGPLVLELGERSAAVAGVELKLRPREYAVLEYLALRRGHLVSRQELELRISLDRLGPLSNVVEASVSQLRRQLREAGCPELIETRRGIGYRLLDSQQ